MPIQERSPKRFHITLQVKNLDVCLSEYTELLATEPCCVIPGYLALWRTSELNLLLRVKSKERAAVLQFGWEYGSIEKIRQYKDHNNISWLFFSTNIQDDAIARVNANLEYNEDRDFRLELRNPNACWNWRASCLLLFGMLLFTAFNHNWIQPFFSSTAKIEQQIETQNLSYEMALLRDLGELLTEAGYNVTHSNRYLVAKHPEQATITCQIIAQQVLFSAYWSIDALTVPQQNNKEPSNKSQQLSVVANTSEDRGVDLVNRINRDAVLCRYYLDEEDDLVIEAWFRLPYFEYSTPENLAQVKDGGKSEQRQFQATYWQRMLFLWQQESSMEWLQSSFELNGRKLKVQNSVNKNN